VRPRADRGGESVTLSHIDPEIQRIDTTGLAEMDNTIEDEDMDESQTEHDAQSKGYHDHYNR